MTRIVPATLNSGLLVSGCASNPADVPIIDTVVWGDSAVTQSSYGKYHVLKGSPVRRLECLEITKSDLGKPVFRLKPNDGGGRRRYSGFLADCTTATQHITAEATQQQVIIRSRSINPSKFPLFSKLQR